jgi:DtxR family Mn-dependent transcriptional regulator
MLTISKENYLKAIYKHQEGGNVSVPASCIADELQVSNAAISKMAKTLSGEGLLDYQKHRGVRLTEEGEKFALKVIRRHRMWELFLIDVLGLTWAEVHDEAEKLEHSTSEFLINKMDEFLGFPKFDPHGSPIPDKHGKLPELPAVLQLALCEPGETYRVARVQDGDSQLMKYLTRIGINLDTEIKIIEKFSFDHSINVEMKGKHFLLSEKVVARIWVVDK